MGIAKGTQSKVLPFFIQDMTYSDQRGITTLTSGSSGLTAYYKREGANATVAITLAAGTIGTYVNQGAGGTGGGFIHVADGTYELSIPDAALVTGANWVEVTVKYAPTGSIAIAKYMIELVADDPQVAKPTAVEIAQATLKEPLDTSESGLGIKSLGWLLAMVFNLKTLTSTLLTVKKTDQSTTLFTLPITENPALAPIGATGEAS